MNTITKWNPFRELHELQNRLGLSLGGFPNRMPTGNGETGKFTLPEWSPSVDIIEDDNEYLVKADLPEVKEEDVKVVLENGIVSMSGERKAEKEEENKKYHRIERSHGSFRRGFLVPEDADASQIKAEFKEGVFRLHMPKFPVAEPKTTQVKIN